MMQGLQAALSQLQPPQWLVAELQNRVVLSLNHVLKQEPEAMRRLQTQSGKSAVLHLAPWSLHAQITPAGLFDVVLDPARQAQLTLRLQEHLPGLLWKALQGAKPQVHIEGDVELAGEMNWLIDHLRWDFEEDLSRLLGDGPAHTLGQGARAAAAALRQFVGGFGGPQS